MKRNLFARLAALIVAGTIVTGCAGGGGGGAGSATSGSIVPNQPPTQPQANVTVQIIIPTDQQSQTQSVRSANSARPMYVSPGTNGSNLTVNTHGSSAQVYSTVTDLSSTSANCTGSAPRVCTIPMVLSAGSYDFNLQTFNAAPVSGVIPGTATQLATATVTQTITSGANNSVAFLLSGIPVGPPTIGCPTGCGAITYMSLPGDGSTHTFTFVVTATDGSGNIITGGNPYSTPIGVVLAESGGSGHSSLVLNGTNVGGSATLTKPSDTLTLSYDGGGAVGYTTLATFTVGSNTTIVRISPMYAPGSFLTHKLSDSGTATITEASAPGSIAYAVTNTCATHVASASASGAGATSTASFNTTAAAGYNGSCTLTLKDNLGTAVSYPLTFAVYGPIGGGGTTNPPTFPIGGSGNCTTGVFFTAAGQYAQIALSDPGFTGTFTTGDTNSAVATVSVTGTTETITAVAAGTTNITVNDTAGNSMPCSVTVTTTSGTVN